MAIELENIYEKLKISKKKEPKPKRIPPVKPLKIPGENLVKNVSIDEIAKELI